MEKLGIKIRYGTPADIEALYGLVCKLAEFERAPDQVENTPEKMHEDCFGQNPVFNFLVAELESDGNTLVVGMAVWYTRYSTWKGRALYLEDIYVEPEWRSKKIGARLFRAVVKEAHKMGVKRMNWQVLEWNQTAMDFYERFGAQFDPEWVNGFLDEQSIAKIASPTVLV